MTFPVDAAGMIAPPDAVAGCAAVTLSETVPATFEASFTATVTSTSEVTTSTAAIPHSGFNPTLLTMRIV